MWNSMILALVAGMLLIGSPVIGQTAAEGEHSGHHPEADKSNDTKPGPLPQPGPAMQPGAGGMGMMGMMGGGRMMAPHEHVEGRLAFLKAELAITPAQESAWSAFAAAVRKTSKEMGMGMMSGAPAAGWPGMLDRHEKMMTSHLESLRAIKAPAMALYATLTEAQKKVADKVMIGPMGPMGPM